MKMNMCESCTEQKCGAAHCTFGVIDCNGYEPVTNADRIRQMTDEELAEEIMRYVDCGQCRVERYGNMCEKSYVECKEAWLDWLKQGVDE